MNRQDEDIQCPICEHFYSRKKLTRHHLVPKSKGGKEIVLICKPCHRQIHATYSEKELAQKYGTLSELLAAEEFQSWINWVRKHPPRKHIQVKTSRRRRR